MPAKARDIISPGARVIGGCELPPNMGTGNLILEEWQVLLTAELSVQPLR